MSVPVVSKATALTAAVVFGGLTLLSVLFAFPSGALVFLLAAVACGLLWLLKRRRDEELTARYHEADGTDDHDARPAMTSSGSSRLFVPPSLDRRDG